MEEEEKLLNAESYYKKALNIDETFQEAEDALLKLRKQIQVILYFLLIACNKWNLSKRHPEPEAILFGLLYAHLSRLVLCIDFCNNQNQVPVGS